MQIHHPNQQPAQQCTMIPPKPTSQTTTTNPLAPLVRMPPAPNPPQLDDTALRQIMLGFYPTGTPPNPNANSFAGFPGMGMPGMDGADDPIMKMIQQMMGRRTGLCARIGTLHRVHDSIHRLEACSRNARLQYIWRGRGD